MSTPPGLHPLELLQLRSLRHLSDRLSGLVRQRLWMQVLLGMLIGIGAGALLGPTTGWVEPGTSRLLGSWLALPGQVFLGLIQMIVVPLVFASVIRGLAATENLEQLRTTGLRAVGFFVGTTTLSITLGIGLALWLEPGTTLGADLTSSLAAAELAPTQPVLMNEVHRSLPDTIVGVLPTNPLGSMVKLEMLQVVLFAAIMGMALVSMAPEQSRPLLDLLGSLQEVSMTVVKWSMRLAPVAVFGLMARLSLQLGPRALLGMSAYVGTVLLGLLLTMGGYLVILRLFSSLRPLTFLRGVRELLLLAFSTSSSAAVMPLSIRTAEDKLGVKASVSQFIIPLGATINMNGTALYQGVATVFLAQVYHVEMDTARLALVVLTAVAASIGSPATPGVGIVILAMVLRSAGVPASGIGLLIGVDRILDMSRTAVNVAGDLVAAVLLGRPRTPSR